MANIKSGKAKINYKDDLSAEARNLIQSILKENPKDRIKLDEIFSHKWITSLDQKYGLNLRRYTEGGAKNSNPDQKAEDKNYKNLQEKNFANDDYLNKLIDERNNEKNKKPTVSFKDKKFINLSESSLNKFGNYKMPVRQDSSLDKPILKNNTSNLNKTKKFDHLKNWNSTDPETGGYISDRQVIKGFMTKADKGQKRLLTVTIFINKKTRKAIPMTTIIMTAKGINHLIKTPGSRIISWISTITQNKILWTRISQLLIVTLYGKKGF